MDGVQVFNSSDIEFDDDDPSPLLTDRLYGQASIDSMIASAEHDRVSSKKTFKQLKFNAPAPGTRAIQSLWVRRFEGFREHVLHQSTNVPFTGQDLVRFFDTIIGKLKPCDSNKPAPSLLVVQNAYKVLLQYGTFRWSRKDGFDITTNDSARFKAFTLKAVQDKRLTQGTWRKRTWVGFITISRMVRVFLEHHLEHGAWNFDVVILKCLTVVLIGALGCRSGDVGRSQGYEGAEHLHYQHIEMFLELEAGEQPQFKHLRAVITLDYTKGHKDKDNESVVKYLRPLDDVQSIHVCPIALLLVHALRNGLVHGTTLQEVLSHTAARPDLHVEWTHPTRPVLTAIGRKPSRCDLDVVTTPRRVLDTIKQMGLLSGMLSRVYAHSLRLGALRDYAHLPKTASNTTASTDDLRKFAGHTHTAMTKGVTEKYVGDLARDYYNDRAENGGVKHHREPKFALDKSAYLDMIERPVSKEEIQKDLDEHQPGKDAASLTNIEKKTVQNRVRRKRREALRSSAVAEPPTPRTASNAHLYTAPVPPPQFHARDVPAGRSPPTTEAHVEQSSPPEAGKEAPVAPSPSSASGTEAGSPGGRIPDSEELVFLSHIDPALLDEETLASLEVAKADISALQAAIFIPNVPQGDAADVNGEAEEVGEVLDPQGGLRGIASDAAIEENMEEAARLLLGQEVVDNKSAGPADTTTSIRTASNPVQWIDGYAGYNVVRNTLFAYSWKRYFDGEASFEESIGHHSMRGNSRDEPTPYMLHCRRTEGCDYTAIKVCLIEQHERSCTADLVESKREDPEAEVLKCDHPGCAYKTTSGPSALKKHVARMHGWTPKPCPEPGCDPEKIYATDHAYRDHQTNAHSGRWPSKCLFPGCPETKEFGMRPTMVYHLKTKHGLLTGEAVVPYLPSRPEQKRWVKQKCVVSTCTSTALWLYRSQMLNHLTSVHNMEAKEAGELIDRKAPLETIVPEKKVLGPARVNAKKRNTQRAFTTAEGKENENYSPSAAASDGVQRPGGGGYDNEAGGGAAPAKAKKPRARK
ncbi:hypothetical protein SLS64_007367 [Diaporthe eres]|uniref:C2H2-type domain-containing protein n=1 Tax=Diaporthe eres TaxID=83184 RepID=A0ABR1PN03_DIAER